MCHVRARATIVETPLVRANGILMVVNITFERLNRKRIMSKRRGVERGAMQQSNGDGKGWGVGDKDEY